MIMGALTNTEDLTCWRIIESLEMLRWRKIIAKK
jgi:hypothetical protein